MFDERIENEPLGTQLHFFNVALSHVEFPLTSCHYESKMVTEWLIQNEHNRGFVGICDRAFGPVTQFGGDYWVDIANRAPDSALAKELWKLLSPEGNLCRIMQSVSSPASRFVSSLQTQWKQSKVVKKAEGEKNLDPFVELYDIPLRLLGSGTSAAIGGESDTCDVTNLPSNRVPPLLLLPFWIPPVVTKEVHGELGPALPCTMLGYFLIRMMLYLKYRAPLVGSLATADTRPTWLRGIDDYFSRLLGDDTSAPKQLQNYPFFEKLFTAYVQHLTNPQIVQSLMSSGSYYDVRWGDSETFCALMIHGPLSLWLKDTTTAESEHYRQPFFSPSTLHMLLQALHMLQPLIRCMMLACDEQSRPQRDCRTNEILNLRTVFVRMVLGALRQALISLPSFCAVPPNHFRTIVSVLYALMEVPKWEEAPSVAAFVVSHYEIISGTLGDLLAAMHTTDALLLADEASLQALCEIFNLLASEPTKTVLADISRQISAGERSAQLAAIEHGLLLCWSRDESAMLTSRPVLFPIITPEMEQRARMISTAVAEHCAGAKTSDKCAPLLREICNRLTTLYPPLGNAKPTVAAARILRTERESETQADTRTDSTSATFGVMSADHKQQFLKGTRQCNSALDACALRFRSSLRNPEDAPRSDEIPLLLGTTRRLDRLVDVVLRLFYLQFCACVPLKRNEAPKDPCSSCARCHSVIFASDESFLAYSGEVVWCRRCAEHPWPKVTLRFFASQFGCLCFVVVVMLWLLFF